MADTETVTIRVSAETKAKLERLAEATRRTKSWHASEAIEAYVARELPIVEMILEGLESARTEPLYTTEEVFAEVDAIIADAERAQKQRAKGK